MLLALAVGGSSARAGICPCVPYLPGLHVGHGSLATPLQGGVIGADPVGGVVTAGLATGAGPTRLVVVRYRPDGSLDPSFGYGGVSFTPATDGMMLSAVAVYGDGRVVVGGSIAAGNQSAFAVTRLRPDGSLDSAFGSGGTVTTQVGQAADAVVALEPLPDGRVVVAGGAPPSNGHAAIALLRYRDDGTLDPSFGKAGLVFTPLPEQPHDWSEQVLAATFDVQGRIVVAGNIPRPTPDGQPDREAPFLARYLADGSPDATFGSGGMVIGSFDQPAAAAVAVLPDGRILAGGELWSGPDGTVTVRRYQQDGSLDSSFGANGRATLGPFSSTYPGPRLVACPDGSSIVFADEGIVDQQAVGTLRKLRPDGTVDSGYGAGGKVETSRISGLVALPDGTVAIAGARPGLVAGRYLADGAKDHAFDHDVPSRQASGAAAIALEPGDVAVTAGWAQRGGRRVVELARFQRSGQLAPGFGTGGLVDTAVGDGDAEATAVVRLSDGRLLAAGDAGGAGVLLRYTAGGARDLTFGTGGLVVGQPGPFRALALQTDGAILVAGGGFSVSRYLADGRVDTSFGTAGSSTPIAANAQAAALAVQPDGRILVAGMKDGSFVVVRLLQNGTLDPSFAPPGSVTGPTGAAGAIALQADGRVLVTGDGFAIARYQADGSRDPTFGVGGVAEPPVEGGRAQAIVAQADGKIAVGGYSESGTSVIARVDEFGYLDEIYGTLHNNHGVVKGDPGNVSALALGNDVIVAVGSTALNGTLSTNVDWYIESGETAPQDGAAIVALYGTRVRAVTHIRTTAPALSPDRRSIAFVSVASGRPELYVVPVTGGKPRKLTTSPFGKESVALGRVSWSPDGRTIAFDAVGHVADPRCTRACLTSDVYAVALNGSRLRRLVSGGADAAWSADGKYLAYRTVPATGASSTFVASADGRSPRRIGPGFDRPLWSPRTDLLAYATGTGFAVSRADGRRVRVFEGDSSPAWSPDGKQLAAFTNYAGLVVVVTLSGRARTLMGGYALRALSWSPDGRRIALFGTRQDVWALIIRDSGTGHLLRRQFGYRASTPPSWSADSSTIYVGG